MRAPVAAAVHTRNPMPPSTRGVPSKEKFMSQLNSSLLIAVLASTAINRELFSWDINFSLDGTPLVEGGIGFLVCTAAATGARISRNLASTKLRRAAGAARFIAVHQRR